MKIKMTVIAVILLLSSNTVAARDYVIALSPYQEVGEIKEQVMQSLKFATTLDGGDTITFINGYHLEPLGTFKVPEGKAYASVKARMNVNKPLISSLMKFAANPPKNGLSPSVEAALRVPQLLRYAGQNFTRGEKTEVIILGSPFYDDPADAAFSMAGGLIPGDGHLLVTREKSPYGIAGGQNALENIRIHWAFGNNAVFPSDQHAYRVERFWQLFVTLQGGEWVTFDRIQETVFTRAKGNAAALPNPHEVQKTERLEMIRLKEVEVKTSIHERPLSSAPPRAEELRRAEHVEIGITWDCQSCDLDLHVRPMPSSSVLFYGHTRSNEGLYYKDFRGSPTVNGGLESVELLVPIDLRAAVIAINFFSGESESGVQGSIRLSLNGQTYAMPFSISAQTGNGGQDVRQVIASNHSSTPETLLINPLNIVGG